MTATVTTPPTQATSQNSAPAVGNATATLPGAEAPSGAGGLPSIEEFAAKVEVEDSSAPKETYRGEKPVEGEEATEAASKEERNATEGQKDGKATGTESVSKSAAADAAARKAMAASRARREREAAQRQEILKAQQAQREAEQLRQQNQRFQEEMARLQQDPYAALKAKGMTDKDLMERALRDGTPEGQIAQLRQVLEQERLARQKLEANLIQERRAATLKAAETKFVTSAQDEKVYPHLSELPDAVILGMVPAIQKEIVAAGMDPSIWSDRDLLEAMELKLARHKTSRAKKTPAAATPAPKTEIDPKTKKPISKTLTNRDSTTKYSIPKNFDDLNDRDAMQALIKGYGPDLKLTQ